MIIDKILYTLSWRAAHAYLSKYQVLELVKDLCQNHPSTGIDLADFAILHHLIRTLQPKCVLECGTGLSTHILAHAMKQYCLPKYRTHREEEDVLLISMEEEKEFFDAALARAPSDCEFLRIIHSPAVRYDCSWVHGMVYRDTPIMNYDLVFVDGPNPRTSCCMDFIRIINETGISSMAVIDSRKTTVRI